MHWNEFNQRMTICFLLTQDRKLDILVAKLKQHHHTYHNKSELFQEIFDKI